MLFFDGRSARRAWPVLGEYIRPNVNPRKSNTPGGAHLGGVASHEERGRSGYVDVVRGLLDQLAIRSGEQVVEVGCGSGVRSSAAKRTEGYAQSAAGME